MPRRLISGVHEWINEIPTVPAYYLAKPRYPGNGPEIISVTTYLPNESALKMDGAQAYYLYLTVKVNAKP